MSEAMDVVITPSAADSYEVPVPAPAPVPVETEAPGGLSPVQNACHDPIPEQTIASTGLHSPDTQKPTSELLVTPMETSSEPTDSRLVPPPASSTPVSSTEQDLPSRVSLLTLESFTKLTGAWEDLQSAQDEQGFTKGCKWAPDGTCILTSSSDNVLRIFNLPESLYTRMHWGCAEEQLPEMRQAVTIREGGTVYDFCWFPSMNSSDPLTCCLASCSHKAPVHLWDAFDGHLRATYNPYNHVDEVEAAYSVAFSPGGDKLYCGFKNYLRIFPVARPGRTCEKRNLTGKHLMPQEQQGGIVSAIAVNPTESKIYAVGTYLKSVGIYAEPDGALLCLLKAHMGGVTHVQFSPDGTKLFTGGRKDPEILCWDLRYPGQLYASMPRKVSTNQRIYFDISTDGRFIFSGNSSGEVTAYNLPTATAKEDGVSTILPASHTWQAHQDCTNGVSLHPSLPILATSAGQRHFSEEDSDTESICKPPKQENSMALWWIGPKIPQV